MTVLNADPNITLQAPFRVITDVSHDVTHSNSEHKQNNNNYYYNVSTTTV